MNLTSDCSLIRLEGDTDLSAFSCDHEDLDDFLHNEAKEYSKQLLGVTYLFRKDDTNEIVGFFTVSNAALNLKEVSRPKKKKIDGSIPFVKRRTSYPSVLIGRLGVSSKYRGNNYNGNKVGPQILDFVKAWFRFQNKTGCRFIIVDAYNEPKVLNFYQKNDFIFLEQEEDELAQLREERGEEAELKTRLMIYDLTRLEAS